MLFAPCSAAALCWSAVIAAPPGPAGNDFSTLYAPLIRDGRMEKFYWAPSREDRIGVCMGIFQHDGVDK